MLEEEAKSPGAGVTGGFEQPGVGAGIGTQVLWKRSKPFKLLSLLYSPQIYSTKEVFLCFFLTHTVFYIFILRESGIGCYDTFLQFPTLGK